MKSKLLRTLYVSLAVMATCAAMLVAATWALFTSTQEVNNHLQAGNMEVTLDMIEKDGATVNVDLTEDASKIFDMTDALPGEFSTAKIVVGNNGDAPFVFDVKIINVALGTDTTASTALMEQVEIAFYEADGTTLIKSFMLDEAGDAANVVEFNTALYNSQSKTIVIKATFTLDADNNTAQNGDVTFDVQVAATQYVG